MLSDRENVVYTLVSYTLSAISKFDFAAKCIIFLQRLNIRDLNAYYEH
jgi:hypothetical protein